MVGEVDCGLQREDLIVCIGVYGTDYENQTLHITFVDQLNNIST